MIQFSSEAVSEKKRAWVATCVALYLCATGFLHAQVPQSVVTETRRIEAVLESWISANLHFFSDVKGNSRLFVRRDPVRAFIHSEIDRARETLEDSIGLFAKFSDLPLEFTQVNPNIIALVTSPINDGAKPNAQLFRRLGLPDSALRIAGESASWATGCGIYTFAGEQAQAALTLIFAEKHLPEKTLSNCLTEGVIQAFGLRTKATSLIDLPDGYLHYLLMAKALRHCDRQIDGKMNMADRPALGRKYLECAVERLLKHQ